VAVAGATTKVLVAVGSGAVVAVGSEVDVGKGPTGVEVKVGRIVGRGVPTSVGAAAGRDNSRESINSNTVKTKPLRKTRTPTISRYLRFIPRSLLPATARSPQALYGMTNACPTRIAFGLSSPFAWASASAVTP